MIARLKGHDDIGPGTILGSNILNGLFIIAIGTIIHPVTVPLKAVATTLGFGILAIVLTYPAAVIVSIAARVFYYLACMLHASLSYSRLIAETRRYNHKYRVLNFR